MRVFLTGATGFIGAAIIPELRGAGHQVLGLARTEAAAQALRAAGAEAHLGSLEDLDSLRRGAAAADGVIHTAFIHDFSAHAAAGATDRQAVAALGAALAGSGRPLVVTSGIGLLTPGRVGTEADAADPASGSPRVPTEDDVLALATQGVRASLVRLPPSVHGVGDHHGFVPALIRIAREQGVSAYLGDGLNRWPAVHRLDAARLYRLALEQGAAGARYHGVAEEGVPVRAIAEAIGRALGLPVVAKAPEEAAAHFGWMARFVVFNCPATSTRTQQELDWQPTHPALLPDLAQGHYFER